MTQLKKIWALVHQVAPAMQLSDQEYKQRLALLGAKRANGSLKGLSTTEAVEVIKIIEQDAVELGLPLQMSPAPVKKKGKNYNPILDKGTPEFKMANTVKYYARKLHWTKGEQVDYDRLDNWLLNKGVHKKKLNEHGYDELVDLVTQIKSVYESHLRELKKSR